jgi:hypothetical protein
MYVEQTEESVDALQHVGGGGGHCKLTPCRIGLLQDLHNMSRHWSERLTPYDDVCLFNYT